MFQSSAERERDRQKEELWNAQWLPQCVGAGLTPAQIGIAKKTFDAGFDMGWIAHHAFLLTEFARENQKQKVHLA